MLSRLIWAALVVHCAVLALTASSEPLTLGSPDGRLTVRFEVKANPQPYFEGERAYYTVSYQGLPVLIDSPLGIDFKDAPALSQGFAIENTTLDSHDSTWENAFDAQRHVRDHYRQLTVSLREKQAPGRRLRIIFRAYDEGIAFRYVLPEQDTLGKFIISSEDTGYYFASDATTFAINLGRFNSNYEAPYPQGRLDQITPASIIGIPLLVHVPSGPWVALLEADLDDYPGMYVGGAPGVPHGLITKLSPHINHEDEAATGSTPKSTPWRVLLINSRPGGLIESDYVVLNLNPPSALKDTSWITTGVAAWDVDPTQKSTEIMKEWIDFAAKHHLPYLLTDVGWAMLDTRMPSFNPQSGDFTGLVPGLLWYPKEDITRTIPAIDLPNVLAYAEQRQVKVMLWIHWTSARRQMDQAFPLCEKLGLAGFKVDFMDDIPDNQEIVNLYKEMTREAAEHHLVLDIHGAYKPTGLRRTYPNLITREGVMGAEYNGVSSAVTPAYDVTIPFTRMLAGPMDYTPGCFHNATQEQFQPGKGQCMGTRAHQLAMYVAYLCPVPMLGGSLGGTRQEIEALGPGSGIEFIDRVPGVWDETHVLNGEPAQYITIARRHGENWYVGSMTNWEPRDVFIPLAFLGSGEYKCQIFADGSDADKVPTRLSISRQQVRASQTLRLHLAPGGGLALVITPAGL
jgi:alpha-glucosidase